MHHLEADCSVPICVEDFEHLIDEVKSLALGRGIMYMAMMSSLLRAPAGLASINPLEYKYLSDHRLRCLLQFHYEICYCGPEPEAHLNHSLTSSSLYLVLVTRKEMSLTRFYF